jgi:hypothetical protein
MTEVDAVTVTYSLVASTPPLRVTVLSPLSVNVALPAALSVHVCPEGKLAVVSEVSVAFSVQLGWPLDDATIRSSLAPDAVTTAVLGCSPAAEASF